MPTPRKAPKAATPRRPSAGAPLVFEKTGAVRLLLPDPHGEVTLEPPTVGQLRQIFELDEAHAPAAAGTPEADANWASTAEFFVGVFSKVYGLDVDVDALPGWMIRYSVRVAVINHWLSVPFDLPASAPVRPRAIPLPAPDPLAVTGSEPILD